MHAAEAAEIDRLLDTTTMHAIHLYQQPLERRGDTTHHNKRKKSTMMTCIRFTVFVVLLAATASTMMFPLKPTLQPSPPHEVVVWLA